jgi:hypothetical protein
LVTADSFQVQGCISIGGFSTSAVPVAAGSMDNSFLKGSQIWLRPGALVKIVDAVPLS